MTRICVSIYRYFSTHRGLCWLSMVVLFAFVGFFATRIHLEEDLNKLMPSSRNADGTMKLAFADLRIKDKVFVLFSGDDPEQLVEACDSFVAPFGGTFSSVPAEMMDDAIGYIESELPAYIDTSLYVAFDTLITPAHIREQMRRNYDDLQGDLGSAYPELIQTDPLGMRDVIRRQLGFLKRQKGSYTIIDDHIFTHDSTVCVAFLTPEYSATNTGQGSALFERMNKRIDEFRQTYPDVDISYHGSPASGYYNSSTIKHDLVLTVGGSLVIVLIIISLWFRRWNTVPLLLLPVVFGTCLGLTVMYFIKGQFSLISLGIGSIVLGVALSYVLHVLTHHKYVGDPARVLREETMPVFLGCLTTVGSFLGLIFVKTELLQDFGIFATAAIVGTTLFSLVYLPQLLGRGKQVEPKPATAEQATEARPTSKLLLMALGAVVVVFAGYSLVSGTQFDVNMRNLGYHDPKVTSSEQLLRDKTFTGDKSTYFASSGKTMEEALHNFSRLRVKLDSLQAAGLVTSYTHTDQLLVPLEVQQQRIDAWHDYWTDDRLRRVRELINAYAPDAGLEASGFEDFFDAATADYEPDKLYEAGLIPEGYLSTLMERSRDGQYLCFTSVRCKNDTVGGASSPYMRICQSIADEPNLLVLDTFYYTRDTLQQLNNDFNVLQWVSMLFVLVVLLFSYRGNLRHTAIAFLPILLSWLVVLGAMSMFGVKFNLINVIISSFIFGIGIDYSIFMMSALLARDGERQMLRNHKAAIVLSAFILVVTVGSMLLATHPAIRSVGFPTLVGLLSAVAFSYVMQPVVFRRFDKK